MGETNVDEVKGLARSVWMEVGTRFLREEANGGTGMGWAMLIRKKACEALALVCGEVVL